jgi:pimeloyl-ACP methyl ester carboxylesterase
LRRHINRHGQQQDHENAGDDNSNNNNNSRYHIAIDLKGRLQEDHVSFMGHSFGGATALTAAKRRPDLIRSVIAHEPAVDWMPDDARLSLLLESEYHGSSTTDMIRCGGGGGGGTNTTHEMQRAMTIAAAATIVQRVVPRFMIHIF